MPLRIEEKLTEEASSKDSTEGGCDRWAVAIDRFDRSCYTQKWAVRKREIFIVIYLIGVRTFGGYCCGAIAACKLD